MDIRQRVEKLQEFIKGGKILEAMSEFYDPNVAMQENANPPVTGLAKNIEREKQFLAGVKQWKGYTVKALAVSGDTSFVENAIDFINTAGQHVHMEQVAVQRWENGRIVHERFYYDSGGKA